MTVAGKLSEAMYPKAAAALATTYTWDSGWIDTADFAELAALLDYVHTDATSLEYKLQVEVDGGTTGYDRVRSPSGTVAVDEHTLAVSATAKLEHVFDVRSAKRVRLLAKRTGGTGGTLAAKFLAG